MSSPVTAMAVPLEAALNPIDLNEFKISWLSKDIVMLALKQASFLSVGYWPAATISRTLLFGALATFVVDTMVSCVELRRRPTTKIDKTTKSDMVVRCHLIK